MAQTIAQPFTLMHGYFGAAIPSLTSGDVARAIPPLEQGLALCRETGVRLWLGEIAADLGLAYALAGRIDDALPVLEFALEEAASAGLRFTYARQHAHVGAGFLLSGRRAEASRLAATALTAARAQKQRGQEALALWLSAEIAADALEMQRANDEYHDCLILASETGMRPLVAHCHFGLGKLRHRSGEQEPRQTHLRAAAAMYREMRMKYWLDKVHAEAGDEHISL